MNHRWMKVALATLAVTIAGSVVAYPFLPKELPMHWNVQGDVDGWGPKHLVVPLLPAAMTDMGGDEPPPHLLAAASAVCPVGVPLDEVAATVRRLAFPPGWGD